MRSYEETRELVYELLLDSEGPMYHGDIKEELNTTESYVGQALMELYDGGRAEWIQADKWEAIPENEHVIESRFCNIHIGHD